MSESQPASGAPKEQEGRRRSLNGRRGRLLIFLLVLAVVGVILVPRFLKSLHYQSTDDAFVDGTIVPVSAQVPGSVLEVLVADHARVHAGDPLLRIDPADTQNAVRQREAALSAALAQAEELDARIEEAQRGQKAAEAQLVAARTQAELAHKEAERYAGMLHDGAVSQNEADQVQARADVAEANLKSAEAKVAQARAGLQSAQARAKSQSKATEQARAALEKAQLDLSRTTVSAPIDGIVAHKNVDPGRYVQVGAPLMAIVDPKSVWITANFKETQIHHIEPGQPVEIDVDAYDHMSLKGHVASFDPGTGAVFSLFPPENATGNFVKVVQRVPVRIELDEMPDPQHPLLPGLSVVPHVRTDGTSPATRFAKSDD